MPGAASPWGLFWAAPHRPLFLAAFLWAMLCIAIWPLGESFGFSPDLPGGAIRWHAHEMIFGFGGAAVGGYLLTALPSWTARDPLAGAPLMAVTALWLMARFAVLGADSLPGWLPGLVSAGYFLTVALILTAQILALRALAKLVFPAVLLLLSAASPAYLSGAALVPGTAPLLLLAFLHALIASRAVPAFTVNWMQLTGRMPLPAVCAASRMAALLLLAAAVLTTAQPPASGALLLAAAAALLASSRGWQSRMALEDPLVCALHVSWFWLIAGLALLGAVRLAGAAHLEMHILHAIAIGALGAKIMAISGRAAAERTGSILKAGRLFLPAVALIWLAALTRLLPAAAPAFWSISIPSAALLWCGAWMLFTLYFKPALTGPPLRPVFSGPKASSIGETP